VALLGNLEVVPESLDLLLDAGRGGRLPVVLHDEALGGIGDARGEDARHAPQRVLDDEPALGGVHPAHEPRLLLVALGDGQPLRLDQGDDLVQRDLLRLVMDADFGAAGVVAEMRVRDPPLPLQQKLELWKRPTSSLSPGMVWARSYWQAVPGLPQGRWVASIAGAA
jgi:hypothetical protein